MWDFFGVSRESLLRQRGWTWGFFLVLGYKTRGLLQKSASRDRARESIENLKFWYTSSNNNNKAAQGSVAYAPHDGEGVGDGEGGVVRSRVLMGDLADRSDAEEMKTTVSQSSQSSIHSFIH